MARNKPNPQEEDQTMNDATDENAVADGAEGTKTISILGLSVTISAPYAAGYTLNAAEAAALNQTRAENIGNNLRKLVSEKNEGTSKEPSYSEEAVAEILEKAAAYDADYNFVRSISTGAKRVSDPVTTEARKLARAAITRQLKEAGRAVKDIDKDKLEAAINTVAEKPAIRAQAEEIVAKRSEMANELLGGLDLPDAPAEEAAVEAAE